MDEYAGGHQEEEEAGGHRYEECARLPVEWHHRRCLLVPLLQLLVGQVLQWYRLIEVIIFRRLSALQRECFLLMQVLSLRGEKGIGMGIGMGLGITYLLPVGLGLGEHHRIDVQIIDGTTNGVDVQLTGSQRDRLALAAGAGSTHATYRVPPVLRFAWRVAHGKR